LISSALPSELSGLGSVFGSMSVPPLYHSRLVVELRQSLLRNFLGKYDRNTEKIIDNITEQKRIMTMQVLSGLIVEALVYYWNIAILEQDLAALQDQLESTRQVQVITQRKVALGLSENIELLQWNSLVMMYESQVKMASKALHDGRRKLLEAVQMPLSTQIEASTSLKKEISVPDFEAALAYAMKHRPDLRSAKLTVQNAELAFANAKRDLMPSLEFVLQAATQGRESSYLRSMQDLPTGRYPSLYAGIVMTAPLYETGGRERAHNRNCPLFR